MKEGNQNVQEGRVRILYVPILFYPDAWNGIMEHMRLLIAGLDRRRYDPLVVVRPNDGGQTRTLVARTGATPLLLSAALSVRELRAVCRAERIGVVHIQTPATGGVPRVAAGAWLGGVRSLIVTYQLVQPARVPWRSRLINRVTHDLVISRTTAISTGVANSLASNCGLNRRHVQVIPYSVEHQPATAAAPAFSRSAGEVWLGYVGRLAEEKGLRYLLDALRVVRVRCPQVRAVLIGDGYERERLEEQSRQLGLSDCVVFAGHRADARALMQQIDIFVLPSLLEGFGLVIVEAMDAGKPVVATRIPGVTDEIVVDGVTGLLVERADPGQLADALSTLVADPARRAAMGAQGRERFRTQFQVDRMIADVQTLYASLAGSSRAPRAPLPTT